MSCSQCGLPLDTPEAARLAALLAEADRTMAALRYQQQSRFSPIGRPTPVAPVLPPTGAVPLPAAGRLPAPRTRREFSGAAILLGLGGLCLVIAAIVFLSVSWTSLSLGAKVAVLAAVTGLLAGAAGQVTRRGLRGSAETLWTISFADLALDLWAARRADLAGLHSLSASSYTAAAAAIVAVLAVACCLATRSGRLASPLVGVQVVLGIAGVVGVGSELATIMAADWAALGLAALVLGALAVAAGAAGLPVTARAWLIGALLPWTGLVIGGAIQIGSAEFVPQLWHGHAWELPVATALAIAAASTRWLLRTEPARMAAAAAGIALAVAMTVAAGEHYRSLPVALAIGTVLAAMLSYLPRRVWGSAGLLVLAASLAADSIAVFGAAWSGTAGALAPERWLWLNPATARLAGTPEQLAAGPSLILLAVTVLALLARRRWLGTSSRFVPWPLSVAALAAVAVTLNARPSIWLATLAWLGAALACGAIAVAVADRTLLLAAGAGLALSLGCSLSSDASSVLAFGAGAALTALASWTVRGSDGDQQRRMLIELAAIGQLFVAVAAAWHRVQPDHGTPAVAGLLLCAAVLAATSALSPTRRWWVWLAGAAMVGAIWIEAAAHQLHAPEPYSVPAGLLALAFGWQAARRAPATSSWLSLGPGLLILSAPSLLLVLSQPLSPRAAVLAAAALAMTLAAARFRWQAPLLIGATELALLAIREIGPYALALPRWVALGAVGALLVGIGISWEEQLANLRNARHRIAGLR